MEHYTLDNWKNGFRHDGLLYFTQRINEMLSPETDHVFKSPVLNTALIVEEYLENAKLVSDKIVEKSYLEPIMKEFIFSFEKDIVIKKHITESKKQLIIKRINSESFDDQKATMEYIKYLLSDYNQWCKDYLMEIVQNEKQKRKIEQVIRSFVPGMIAFGYSSEFMFQYNIEIFSKQPVYSINSLQKFLDRFDFKERKYDVFIAIDIGATRFHDVLEKRLPVKFGPFGDEIEMLYDKEKYALIKCSMSAFDEYSAVDKSYDSLNIFFTFYRFLTEQKERWYFNETKVVDHEKNEYIIPLKRQLDHSENGNIEFTAQASDSTIMSLQNNASSSCDHIRKVLKLHNTAIDDPDIKNRFLNFWSILEIIFAPDKGKNKSSFIVKNLLPVLLNDYLLYLFSSINMAIREIEKSVDLKSIENQFSNEDKGGWPFFMFLEQYKQPLDMLYDLLGDYPLLRSRIAFDEEMCKNKRTFLSVLNAYSDRVTWHITRLYRTRNNIVHSGLSQNNLQELVEHLHSYVDQSLVKIVSLLALEKKLENISNSLITIQLQNEEFLSLLDNHSPITRSDLISFLMNC